ncbi:hypothetical protein [Metabacillus endolithicus]|uniref:Uncharacterized protein n=1 Tax=Metabacillus endolithicus TaxID=1535204 RepID=A0ABW5BY26_9BACI|nr:hypothetical protein [Metabacillus endolithicus]UPG65321.1 hypothetical protein MVE64_10250 [Metabacillus endolithicus]
MSMLLKNLIPIFVILLLSAGAWLIPSEQLHSEIPALEVFGKIGTTISVMMIMSFLLLYVIYRLIRKRSC